MATAGGPVPILAVSSGVATGTLSVQGPVNDPDYSGQLELVGGGVRSAYSPDEAGPITTTLFFEGKTFRTPKIFASVGIGAAELPGELYGRPLGARRLRYRPCHRRAEAHATEGAIRAADFGRLGHRPAADSGRRQEDERDRFPRGVRLQDHPRGRGGEQVRPGGCADICVA